MIANGGSKTNFFFQESVKSWWRYMYLNNRTTIYRDSFRPITICRGSMTFTWSPSIRWVPHHNVKRIKRNKKAFKGNLYSLGQLCLRAWDFRVDARETANFFAGQNAVAFNIKRAYSFVPSRISSALRTWKWRNLYRIFGLILTKTRFLFVRHIELWRLWRARRRVIWGRKRCILSFLSDFIHSRLYKLTYFW